MPQAADPRRAGSPWQKATAVSQGRAALEEGGVARADRPAWGEGAEPQSSPQISEGPPQ